MNLIRKEPEAFYSDDDLKVVGEAEMQALKDEVHNTPRKRIRLCTHTDIDALLHEMFVCYTKDTIISPHKHVGNEETFYIMEGKMDLLLYDEWGTLKSRTEMGERGSGKPFCVRVPADTFHTVTLHSDYCLIHLANCGPFDRSKTVWASWKGQL